MQVNLPAELKQYVEEQLSSGKHASPDDVIAQALRVMRNVQRALPAAEADLRKKIDAGLRDFDEGRDSDWDVDELKRFILSDTGRASPDKKAS